MYASPEPLKQWSNVQEEGHGSSRVWTWVETFLYVWVSWMFFFFFRWSLVQLFAKMTTNHHVQQKQQKQPSESIFSVHNMIKIIWLTLIAWWMTHEVYRYVIHWHQELKQAKGKMMCAQDSSLQKQRVRERLQKRFREYTISLLQRMTLVGIIIFGGEGALRWRLYHFCETAATGSPVEILMNSVFGWIAMIMVSLIIFMISHRRHVRMFHDS